MTNVVSRLLPHRLIDEYLYSRIYAHFATANGLFYIGNVDTYSDDHTPIRGFTMSARAFDRNLMSGTVEDRDVTVVRRTDMMISRPAPPVTWTIMSVKLSSSLPSALFMSHNHPHDVYQAAFIGLVRSEHVAIHYQLDATFLIYTRRTDVDDLRIHLTDEAVTVLLRHPEFDYELSGDTLNVYLCTDKPDMHVLTALLSQALAVAKALDAQ